MAQKLRTIVITFIALIVFTGTASAYTTKTVTLIDNNIKVDYVTTQDTVDEFLESKSIQLSDDDVLVGVSLSDSLEDGMQIVIRRAFPVTIYVDDKANYMRTSKETVGDLLEEFVEDIDLEYVLEDHKENDLLKKNMEIYLLSVTEKEMIKEEEIPFGTETVYNAEVAKGVETILTEGEYGLKAVTYKQTFIGKELTNSVAVSEEVIERPVKRVIEIGTAENVIETSAGTFKYGEVLTMTATAYTQYDAGCTSTTAMGLPAKRGVVAVDPRIIPLGTKVYVEGYGYAIAGDTGGAIKGNKIDLCMDTLSEAYQYGRRTATVYVLQD